MALGLALSAPAARADDRPQVAGDSLGALPGVARVGVAGALAAGTDVSAFAGYGFTGHVIPGDTRDRHHRALSELAATWRPARWLGFGVRLDGRYDKHLGVAGGEDDGWVGDPRLLARAVGRSGDFAYGGQLSLWFPGADAPSLVPAATSADAVLLGTYAPIDRPFTVSGNLGYRLDRSAESVENPQALSLADRMALGASDADALLAGVGATYRAGSVELLGEWTWDLLLGDRAPPATDSPMRVTGGLRLKLTDRLTGQLLIDLNVAGTPAIDRMSALVPIEPRVRAMAGLHLRFAAGDHAGDRLVHSPPPKPEPASLAGRVVSGGVGIAGARVKIVTAGAGEPIEVVTDDSGGFEVSELEPGEVRVSADADGYEVSRETVRVGAGERGRVELILDEQSPPGQLRGVVRSLRGQPLEAALTVEPIGVQARSGPDGAFEIDLPPGRYQLVIRARGHAEQRQRVQIEKDGVTIINVDLRPRR